MDIHSLISTWRTHYKKRSQRQKTTLKLVGSFLGIILLFSLCMALSTSPQPAPQPLLIRNNDTIKIPSDSPLRTLLQVQPVKTSNAPHIVVLPGIVEANQRNSITILPPVTGHLLNIYVQLGEEVKKGQILATMQSSTLAQIYADELKAQSALKQASEALNRAQKVNRAGANAVKDIEQIQNNYTQTQAELQRAQASLASLGTNKDNLLQIQAPIDGKITSLNYGPGSYINDATLPLFTLANTKNIWVTMCVPENSIAAITKGQKVEVHVPSYPQQIWHGQITFTNNLIDPETRCNKSRVALDNTDEHLQPNMFASIQTKVPQPEQIIVPLSAVLMNNDTTAIFIETAPWTFKQHAVVLGAEDGNEVRITSGLKAGDRIVTAGGILIND